jgi:hypothetical protein
MNVTDRELEALIRYRRREPVCAADLPLLAPNNVPDDGALMTEFTERILAGISTEFVRLTNVMGAKEVAEATGVAQTNIRATKGMPEPIHRIGATSIYHGAQIRHFAAERRSARPESQRAGGAVGFHSAIRPQASADGSGSRSASSSAGPSRWA